MERKKRTIRSGRSCAKHRINNTQVACWNPVSVCSEAFRISPGNLLIPSLKMQTSKCRRLGGVTCEALAGSITNIKKGKIPTSSFSKVSRLRSKP